MTPEGLRELISKGESLSVEFKGEEKRPLSDRELIEAVVCLASDVLRPLNRAASRDPARSRGTLYAEAPSGPCHDRE